MSDTTGLAALRRAKDILGSERALADVVGVKQPTVNYALNKDEGTVPAEWAIPIDRATADKGERVSCHQLRPDLWPGDFVPEASDAAA